MTRPFADITLGEHLPEKSHQIEGQIYRIFLALSDEPPQQWIELFDDNWRLTIYSMKRHAGVVGDSLWIDCIPEEVKQHHRVRLEAAISEANAQFRRRRAAAQRELARREIDHLHQQKRLDDLET